MTNTQEPSIESTLEKTTYSPGVRRFFKILEYLALDACVACLVLTLFFRENQLLITLDAALLASFVFLGLFNNQYFSYGDRLTKTSKYEQLLKESPGTGDRLKLEKENALRYCQQLIDDYSKTRRTARNSYYILQLATIIFSGVTPILVLVDKLETGSQWLKWLPVIFPAIASILASVGTSFPLETQWKDSNKIVENLEAEQEKFLLGITQDPIPEIIGDTLVTESERTKLLEAEQKRAIINFVNKVNEIHLQQVQAQAQIVKEAEPEANKPGTEPKKPENKPLMPK
ncbi:conserved hypothetical protein [Rippkaea orientalis PCC 8801]|uniref:DUF4231 domain-containing protein n=1 Tax=Rippkaea orientalis (strain PCC 8801 / RF-1) TaxID=41431 RepID=B7K401_RIPO1|nr:DUF4231 domain-containing protein [Rippkaea orientalis]ACK66541.1 conserved hypothetical protein [Rippkaea orientalis PCC 8801]